MTPPGIRGGIRGSAHLWQEIDRRRAHGLGVFRYRAHGLSLCSEIELPEAVPAQFDEPDVTIRYGEPPPMLTDVRDEGAGHQIAPRAYRLEVAGVAVYGLRDGRDLVVAPAAGAAAAAVRGPLLSSVMAAAVHERGYFALHASTVAIDGGCVLFTGASGAGKSTLAAACNEAGLPVLTDDLVAVEVTESAVPIAHPGYRVLKLWSDALGRFGGNFADARPVEGCFGKFGAWLPAPAIEQPLPVHGLFDLGLPAQRLSIERVAGATKVRKLLGRMYRRRQVPALGHSDRAFFAATAIARHIPVWMLHAPRGWSTVRHTVAEVRRTLAEART